MTRTSATLRASDGEREHTATLLREHCQHGRLSIDELAERLSDAFTARTRAELDGLLGDLPDRGAQATAGTLRRHVRTFLVVNGLLVGIWLTGGAGYFWPIWPFLGWGIGLAAHALAGDTRGRGSSQGERLTDIRSRSLTFGSGSSSGAGWPAEESG